MTQHPYVLQRLAEQRIEDLQRDAGRRRPRRTSPRPGAWTRHRR